MCGKNLDPKSTDVDPRILAACLRQKRAEISPTCQNMPSNKQATASRPPPFLPIVKRVWQRTLHPFKPAFSIFWPRLAFLLSAPALFAADKPADKLKNSDCLDCHTDPSNTRMVNGVKESARRFSRPTVLPVRPLPCWIALTATTASRKWFTTKSAAAELLRLPRQGGEGLRDEHPRHEPRDGRVRRGAMLGLPRLARHLAGEEPVRSPVFKMNLPATCAKCHSNTNLTKEYQIEIPEAATNTWTASTATRC